MKKPEIKHLGTVTPNLTAGDADTDWPLAEQYDEFTENMADFARVVEVDGKRYLAVYYDMGCFSGWYELDRLIK